MTRDSKLWPITLALSIITAIGSHQDLLKRVGFSAEMEALVELFAVILGAVAATMIKSPLDISDEGREKYRAKEERKRFNSGRGLGLMLALAIGASSCASTGKLLAESDRGIHATITTVDDVVNRACDAKLRSAASCKAFNAVLADAYAAYQRFNLPAQDGSIAGVPAMVTALADLRDAVLKLAPQAQELIADLKRWADLLRTLLPKEGGDAQDHP